jgi:hypothetical protein
MITQQQLNLRLGQAIKDICPNGYANSNDNHCAHYVSHVLGYDFGLTCKTMSAGKFPGVTLRVRDLFKNCPQAGGWNDLPAILQACLVFVTDEHNVDLKHKRIADVPRKHVGIYVNGGIWHYSNSNSKVVKQTPEQFSHHYHGSTIKLFYGTFPNS